jgi:hypothetical protein
MAESLALMIVLWCTPSLALVAIAAWHLYRAQLRVRELHLDVVFARHRARGGSADKPHAIVNSGLLETVPAP